LNQSEPNVILTAHATKVNRPEPNWTEPQTCLAGRNHAFNTIDTSKIRLDRFWFDQEIKYNWKADIHTGSRSQVDFMLN